MNTNKTLVVACCIGLASIAWAQGKPATPAPATPTPATPAKPATPPAAAPKPGEHEHEHMMGKPGEHMGEHMGKPGEHMGEHMGKPGEHMGEHMGKPGEPPAGAGAMPMPKPAPELEAAWKPFEGTWKCDSKFPAGAMGPGSPEMTAKSTVRFKKVQKGFYYLGEYEIKKSKTMPGMKGSFLISYQPGAKTFVITGSDDMGGAMYETSPGFSGDTITFTGEGYMMGQKMKIRESMSHGDKTSGHKMEVDMGKGFQSMGEDTCTR